jgi:hypothetical protein
MIISNSPRQHTPPVGEIQDAPTSRGSRLSNTAATSSDSGLLAGCIQDWFQQVPPTSGYRRSGGGQLFVAGNAQASATNDGKERISPEGYSVTADEKQYLRCLCGGSKTAEQIADEVAADPVVSNAHPPATVADRLAYPARYGGTEHLLDRDGDRYALTEDGKVIFY